MSDDLSGLEQAAMATAAGVGLAGGAAVALPLIGGLMAIPFVGPFLAFGALVGISSAGGTAAIIGAAEAINRSKGK
jgi:hypothetical protein